MRESTTEPISKELINMVCQGQKKLICQGGHLHAVEMATLLTLTHAALQFL